MERRGYSGNMETLAAILEHGDKNQRRSVFREMAGNSRLCETVLISLRAMALFNQKRERYEFKK